MMAETAGENRFRSKMVIVTGGLKTNIIYRLKESWYKRQALWEHDSRIVIDQPNDDLPAYEV